MTLVLVSILAALLGAGAGLWIGRRTGWFGAIGSIFAGGAGSVGPVGTAASYAAKNPMVSSAVARATGAQRVAAGSMLTVLP